ncbi:wall-associated receptor kinase 4-like [Triticum aestivum]|uniref:wall-associated receptor kinase 4-like n=1 Tax=Triticum aestivum TaxID=4565 RepID=UPI001D023315|nr:wall-associated receptor kinase 4-like [Triticum aestivum]
MTRNVLMGVGWDAEAMVLSSIVGSDSSRITCESYLRGNLNEATNGSCSRRGCCQASFPEAVPYDTFYLDVNGPHNNTLWETNPCSYAMVVESSWYNFSTPDLYGDEVQRKLFPRGVPYVLDFAIRSGSCPPDGQPAPACASANSHCATATRGPGYVCKCLEHYEGNPYIAGGCKDINECEHPDLYPCSGTCMNKPGGYDCPCKRWKKGDGKAGTCAENFPLVVTLVVGAIGGISCISIVTLVILLRKEKRKMREFYEKNGGPTLQKAKLIKLFKKEELRPILKSRNFIGKGGFSEVYKGSLLDIGLVAVKKPISGSVLENKQFANEVIIQSQVIHKNIVRLIGCCLEVDIPMLVYEFLSKGSLDDILHNNNDAPLDLHVRLRIAADSADGLAYMHSKAHTRILHGDVKPANILLDDNFVPKISDFGISRLIVRDKQHTNTVIGDRSYMDPEYLRSGLLTEKSDVYSFGVVILELISRQIATHSDGNRLVENFLEAHNENRAAVFFDEAFTRPCDLDLLSSLAVIAMKCLEHDVDQRPSMIEVAQRILTIYHSHVTLVQ